MTNPRPLADLVTRLRAAESNKALAIGEAWNLLGEAAASLEECARDFRMYAQEHGESCGEDGSEECTCGLTAARKRWTT